jgi:HEAT repeat protein
VRKLAALALARIGDDAANDALTAALEDDSPDVRNAARAALRHIANVS